VARPAVALHIERLTIDPVTSAAGGAGGERPGRLGPKRVVARLALTLFASQVGCMIERHIPGFTVENQAGGRMFFPILGRNPRASQRGG